jgi:acetylornithine deacetylase/succinyl-diaminopimelate desuccinylase-like protein
MERIGARPSMDVLKIEAGQPKSAIPARATANISFRLVPDQDPAEIQAQFQRYVETHLPPTVRCEIQSRKGAPGVLTNRNMPAVQEMFQALEAAFGGRPVFQRIGGSISAVLMFQEVLGVDSLLTGFSLVDDGLHGPNEKIHLPTWRRGTQAVAAFFNQAD